MKSEERSMIVFDLNENGKPYYRPTLTAKQYLVYSYLCWKSYWNAKNREDHYVFYFKDNRVLKDDSLRTPPVNVICKQLNISQPTWRSALNKLEEYGYIYDRTKEYCKIIIPAIFVPLPISTIDVLVRLGSSLHLEHGGYLPAMFCTVCHYFNYCNQKGKSCELSASSLAILLFNDGHDRYRNHIRNFFSILYELGLIIYVNEIRKNPKNGTEYIVKVIKGIRKECLQDSYSNEELQGLLDMMKEKAEENYGKISE